MPLKLEEIDLFTIGYENRFAKTAYPLMLFQIQNFEEVQFRIMSHIDEIENINLKNITNHTGDTGAFGATLSHSVFNFFDTGNFEELRIVLKEACLKYQKNVFDDDSKLIQKCWGNKLYKFDFLQKHPHVSDFMMKQKESTNLFSLHLTVKSSPLNKTVYTPASNVFDKDPIFNGSFYSPNVEGQITLFPSSLAHFTTPNVSEEARYSLAMDVESLSEETSHISQEMRAF